MQRVYGSTTPEKNDLLLQRPKLVGKYDQINRFDISASDIDFDLNIRLLGPGLVDSTCGAHMRSE